MNNLEIIEAIVSESKSRREEAARCFLRNWNSYFISRSEKWRIGDAARQNVQQNICLKVLVHAGSFRGTSEGQAVNWIRTIAEREFNSYWRKNFPQNASPVAYVESDTNSTGVEDIERDTGVLDDASEDSSFGETVPTTDFSGYLNSVIESGELAPEENCLTRFKQFSMRFPRQALALVLRALGHNSTEKFPGND